MKAERFETTLYGCLGWNPSLCHYDVLRRAHHNLFILSKRIAKNKRTDYPISYLGTLVKTGSESVEVTLRKMRVLLAGFVSRMENTRLPKSVMLVQLVRANQWIISSQGTNKWYKTVKQEAKVLMTNWISAQRLKAALRYAVVCSNVTGRNKEKLAQSRHAPAILLATAD